MHCVHKRKSYNDVKEISTNQQDKKIRRNEEIISYLEKVSSESNFWIASLVSLIGTIARDPSTQSAITSELSKPWPYRNNYFVYYLTNVKLKLCIEMEN